MKQTSVFGRTPGFRHGMKDSAVSAEDFAKEQAALILNGRVDFDESVSARGGSVLWRDAGALTGRGRGVAFATLAGARRYLAIVGTVAYEASAPLPSSGSTAFTSIATGLRDDWWSITSMIKSGALYMLLANGGASGYQWNGSAWSTITNLPSGVKYLQVFNDRLYAAGHAQSTVAASAIGNYELWTAPDGLSLPIQTHDSDRDVLGLLAVGEVLLVFKRHSVSWVDGFGNSDVIVASGARGLTGSVGIVGFRTAQRVGDHGAMWLSERGIEYWPGRGRDIQLVGDGVRMFMDTIAKGQIANDPGLPCAVYYQGRNEYWLSVPSSAYATSLTPFNDVAICVNVGTLACTRWTWSNAGSTLRNAGIDYAMDAMCAAETIVGAESANKVYVQPMGIVYNSGGQPALLDYGTRDLLPNSLSSSSAYDIHFRVRTRPYVGGSQRIKKRARRVFLSWAASATHAAKVLVRTDGTDGTARAVSLAASVNGAPQNGDWAFSETGFQHQVDIEGTGGLKIAGIELESWMRRY